MHSSSRSQQTFCEYWRNSQEIAASVGKILKQWKTQEIVPPPVSVEMWSLVYYETVNEVRSWSSSVRYLLRTLKLYRPIPSTCLFCFAGAQLAACTTTSTLVFAFPVESWFYQINETRPSTELTSINTSPVIQLAEGWCDMIWNSVLK